MIVDDIAATVTSWRQNSSSNVEFIFKALIIIAKMLQLPIDVELKFFD